MRSGSPCGLVMALTLGLVLMMSQKVECQGNDGGSYLARMITVASRFKPLSTTSDLSSLVSSSPSPIPSPPMEPSTPSPLLAPLPSTPSPTPSTISPPVSPTLPPLQPIASSPKPSKTPPPSMESPSPTPSTISPPPAPSPLEPSSPSPASSEGPSTSPPAPMAPPPTIAPSTSPSSPPTTGPSTSGLKVGYYKGRCPTKTVDVEALIATEVEKGFNKDPSVLPAVLRMQFHDCFVHGCDASILIEGDSTEKTAGPNLSVRGYEFIEDLKATAEAKCPGVVSCADIIAIATQVTMRLGGGPDFAVETGRRDGLVSKAEDVNLPNPFMQVSESVAAFAVHNFTVEEMVVLLGAHTVGTAHCVNFQDRLYSDMVEFDPLMDPTLRKQLVQICPQDTASDNSTFLDHTPGSSNSVDNAFYTQLLAQRGIFALDQALARDPSTKDFVKKLASSPTFFNSEMAKTIVKLQAVDVLTGTQGEIRKVCSSVN